MDSHEVNHQEYHLHKLTVAPYVKVVTTLYLWERKLQKRETK